MKAIPPSLTLRPISEADKDGRFRIVFREGREFAVVRWDGSEWAYSSSHRLGFEPTHCHDRTAAVRADG